MSKLLLATDLDKTLLDDCAEVPEVCLDAIRTYVEHGGIFTVSTGRPMRSVLIYPDLTKLVNAPIITYNGACIYDVQQRRAIWRQLLPESFAPLVRSTLDLFPEVGALVFCGEDDFTCAVRANAYTREIAWTREHYDAPFRTLDEIELPWNKVVMTGPPEVIAACADYIRANILTPITIILSEGKFLELTGPGVSKGNALRQVAKLLRIDQAHVVSIGDSMNDIEMIRWAGKGVAVANAELAVRQAADLVVASNIDYGICACIRDVMLPMLANDSSPRRNSFRHIQNPDDQ